MLEEEEVVLSEEVIGEETTRSKAPKVPRALMFEMAFGHLMSAEFPKRHIVLEDGTVRQADPGDKDGTKFVDLFFNQWGPETLEEQDLFAHVINEQSVSILGRMRAGTERLMKGSDAGRWKALARLASLGGVLEHVLNPRATDFGDVFAMVGPAGFLNSAAACGTLPLLGGIFSCVANELGRALGKGALAAVWERKAALKEGETDPLAEFGAEAARALVGELQGEVTTPKGVVWRINPTARPYAACIGALAQCYAEMNRTHVLSANWADEAVLHFAGRCLRLFAWIIDGAVEEGPAQGITRPAHHKVWQALYERIAGSDAPGSERTAYLNLIYPSVHSCIIKFAETVKATPLKVRFAVGIGASVEPDTDVNRDVLAELLGPRISEGIITAAWLQGVS